VVQPNGERFKTLAKNVVIENRRPNHTLQTCS
jgi:hypothetical protein